MQKKGLKRCCHFWNENGSRVLSIWRNSALDTIYWCIAYVYLYIRIYVYITKMIYGILINVNITIMIYGILIYVYNTHQRSYVRQYFRLWNSVIIKRYYLCLFLWWITRYLLSFFYTTLTNEKQWVVMLPTAWNACHSSPCVFHTSAMHIHSLLPLPL